jgi:flagellar biogenesis protein FliO
MGDAARIVLSLVVVLGGLLTTARLARRSKGAMRNGLRIVSRVPVSRGSSLLVVSAGSRMLLVGATERSLQLLSELDPADFEPVHEASVAPGPAGSPEEAQPASRVVLLPAAVTPSSPAVPPATTAASRSTNGPWTGLVRNLQRMTLRTASPGYEGPFRVRKR